MKTSYSKLISYTFLSFSLFSILSCSKDTNLLSDYVNSKGTEASFITNLAIADRFLVIPKEETILDVLANDTFTNGDDVEIIKTSKPANGTIQINKDKTLTYIPNEITSNEEQEIIQAEDAFTYTTESTNENGTRETQEADVSIKIGFGESAASNSSGNYPSNAVYASDYGFKSGDATAAFQAALKSGKPYIVIDKQSSDWVIQPTKILYLQNTTIVFEAGVVLRAKSGAFSRSGDMLLNLAYPKNVTIEGYGATFRMNKSEYNKWENRHTLAIHQGDNITIKGLTLRDSGGDGIYLAGGGSDSSYSKNITIEDVICDNNRRQGMSIISAEDVWVRNSTFKKSGGTAPESGVDLEPSNPSQRLVNINFSNCKFSDNNSYGLLVSPNNLSSSSRAISVTINDSEFKNNSLSPKTATVRTEIYFVQSHDNNPVKGNVDFNRVKFTGSKHKIIKGKKTANAYKVTFKDCSATNVSTNGTDSVIVLEAYSKTSTTGNYVFDNFYLEYSKNIPFMEINAPSNGHTIKDIIGDFRIKEPYDNALKYSGGYSSSKNSNVNIKYNHIN